MDISSETRSAVKHQEAKHYVIIFLLRGRMSLAFSFTAMSQHLVEDCKQTAWQLIAFCLQVEKAEKVFDRGLLSWFNHHNHLYLSFSLHPLSFCLKNRRASRAICVMRWKNVFGSLKEPTTGWSVNGKKVQCTKLDGRRNSGKEGLDYVNTANKYKVTHASFSMSL